MDGHAVQVGGAIVDSGNFDWDAYGHKYHGLTEPMNLIMVLFILNSLERRLISQRQPLS